MGLIEKFQMVAVLVLAHRPIVGVIEVIVDVELPTAFDTRDHPKGMVRWNRIALIVVLDDLIDDRQ